MTTDLTTPRPSRTRITGAEREQLTSELVAQYEAGMSIRALSVAYSRSYGWVHRILRDAGVDLRPRGGNHSGASAEPKPKKLSRDEQREYRDRLAAVRPGRKR